MKFDRNDFGHPFDRITNYDEAKRIILDASDLIRILENRLKETRSQLEVENDKAREILGGKSTWGGPILYGDPKEKLEQLKGYQGKIVDKIREELKKEIEQEKIEK